MSTIKYKLFSIVLVLAMLLAACDSPSDSNNIPDGVNEVVVHPEDPAVQGTEEPVFVEIPNNTSVTQEVTAAILNKVLACPVREGELSSRIAKFLQVTAEAQLRLCDGYQQIAMGSLYITALGSGLSALEPGPVGEATQGAVLVGGQVVGWIYVGTGLIVAAGSVLLGDIVGDLIFPTSVELSVVPEFDGMTWVPEEAVTHLLANGHALEHATARCIAELARRVQPNRVYYSPNAPLKGIEKPSVMFVWYGKKGINDLGDNTGECRNVGDQLVTEYGREIKRNDVNLVMVVGFDGFSYFSFSAYPVLQEVMNAHLCEWGYKLQLYPNMKVNPANCPGGY